MTVNLIVDGEVAKSITIYSLDQLIKLIHQYRSLELGIDKRGHYYISLETDETVIE